MGFFKELKEDFSQAVNELMPEEEFFEEGFSGDIEAEEDDSPEEETEEEPPTEPAKDKRNLNEILEEEVLAAIDALKTDEEFIPYEEEAANEEAPVTEEFTEEELPEEELTDEELLEQGLTEEELIQQMIDEDERIQRELEEKVMEEKEEKINEPEMEDEGMSKLQENKELEIDEEASDMELIAQLLEADNDEDMQVDEEILASSKEEEEEETPVVEAVTVRADDVTIITKGTRIEGNISSDGSLEVMGVIAGDINCQGKLSIVGTVKGNSRASEIYVNTARLDGGLISDGSVKVGVGTIVVGDVKAGSAVIAGAIKGEVDVNGPVIIDSTAIVKGNINAKSVQINNGAVIDGYCSLAYAAVDIDNFFDGEK